MTMTTQSEGSSSAFSDTHCDSDGGEITQPLDALMESVLIQTVQCVAEVPRIVLWC